jgi:AraC-like DNA-binding protein
MTERPGESELVRRVRSAWLNSANRFPNAAEIGSELGLSLRTFHRRLADDGQSYQSIVDDMRRSLATELLENTNMGIDQIAERIGFADATSFRKAFKKWTNRSPSDFRSPTGRC